MTEYNRALSVRPRPSSIPSTTFRALLEDNGVLHNGVFDIPKLVGVSEAAGTSPELAQLWINGKAIGTWRDLSALALALDCHPEFSRRLPEAGAQGPWFVTRNATEEYMDITVGRLDYDDARNELAEMARATLASARIPRTTQDGKLQYRGPKPLRLALVVAPPKDPSELPALVSVQPTHEGIHVTVSDEMAGDYYPIEYRNWLNGWLFQQFKVPTSTSLGPESFAFGVKATTLDEAQAQFRREMRAQLRDAAHMLQNATIEWGHGKGDARDRSANQVRVAALAILQFSARHPRALQLTLDQQAFLVRVSEANLPTRNSVIAAHHGELFGFADRLRSSLEG